MRANRPLLGIALMVGAMMLFPYLDVCAKFLGQWGVPVIEIVWARLFFSMVITAPILIAQEGISSLKPRDTFLNTLRGFFLVISTLTFFGAFRNSG